MLYFFSARPGGSGSYDLWQVPIEPVVDFNGDGTVDSADLCIMIDYWGTNERLCDIGPKPIGDGIVDFHDMVVFSEYLLGEPLLVDLAAHWKLDETEGTIAYDSVGRNDAYVFGNPIWQPTGGQVDGALEMDGVDDCFISDSVLNPADEPFRVLAWLKGGAPGQVILSQMGVSNWLYADSVNGYLMTDLKASGTDAKGPLASEAVIIDGQWHRIGLVWDGVKRTLYIDNIVVAEDRQTGLESSQNGLYIGTGKTMQPGTYWSGLIDDVRIYNRAFMPQ
jgi:hypothetical protein